MKCGAALTRRPPWRAWKLRFRVVNQENKQWIWLALDAITKEIVGVHVGKRSRQIGVLAILTN